MRKTSLLDRLRYEFDNTMSRGTGALVVWLGIASVVLIVAVSLVVVVAGIAPADESGSQLSFWQVAWMGLMRTLDAGTMGGDAGSWPFLMAMLAVTMGGIFLISSLIGVLTTGLERRLEELRKGRSRVVEEGHTVILGWSPQVFSIISELVVANASKRRSCIVVLADKDKVEMEDEIRQAAGPTGRTRVVCRTGSPIEMANLDLVSLNTARSIIIVSTQDGESDAQVLKTMLAITHNPQRKASPYHIVAGLRRPENVEVAQLIGREESEIVLIGSLISRVVAQTCRQSGLSVVYTELLDFAGDEIYFREEPALVGRTFAEALLAYEGSAVIGLCPQDGRPRLNPPMDTCIEPGDQIIAISADDSTLKPAPRPVPAAQPELMRSPRERQSRPERTLILGWNWRVPSVIRELDHYVAPGSSVTVVAADAGAREVLQQDCCGLANQTLEIIAGDTTDRRTLDGLKVERFDHVIVLSYSDTLDVQAADARTLITLLHLRDIADRSDHPFSIVSEMLDIRNRNLAEVTHADDFIVSDRLVSLMLSQISENKALNAVFADIFDPEGSEIYIRPAEDYVAVGAAANFYTVVAAAAARGEVAFGYRRHELANDAGQAYGIVINPAKSEPVRFEAGDRVIVLAER